MNINKFTIKSQEAIQLSTISSGFWPTADENEHVFKAIFDVDENVAPFILKK
jgi:ATP-dependent Clp protease ATP-binding subunit ClpB